MNSDGTATVSCKVPAQWIPLLNMIAKSRDACINDLLKLCLQFLIETAKLTTEPSPDMRTLLNMMKVDANWASMFNYVNNGKLDVAQAILVLQQSKDGKPREGYGIALFNKPFMGCGLQSESKDEEGYMTLSKDEILERVVELVMGPDDYKALRDAGRYLESGSVRETLSHMINAQIIDNMNEADRQELPGLGEFHDFGKMIAYGQRTKGYKHRTPDSLSNAQQKIVFNDFDRDIAEAEANGMEGEHIGDHITPEEMEEKLGYKPFDVEP